MIKLTILILFGAIGLIGCEPFTQESRQLAYPPYFHSVAYPVGYGWGIAAYVLAVFKAVFLFSIYVIGMFYEAGFTRQSDARAKEQHEDRWLDLIGRMAKTNAAYDCWREVQCEADAYMASNPLLRILSGHGPKIKDACRNVPMSGNCKAITVGDAVIRSFSSLYAKSSTLLNTFLRDSLS